MSIRLQELHPALVHLPITLLPAALAIEAYNAAAPDQHIARLGRATLAAAVVSGAVSALTGLIAQEEVDTRGAADLLETHRNLNVSVVGLTAGLWAARLRADRPAGAAFFAAGLLGVATVCYTGYLGSKMVYDHGVGVAAAGGLREGGAPEVTRQSLGEVTRRVTRDLQDGARHVAEDVGSGRLAPALRGPRG